tara:strand:+ start:27 stop:536 length:510 start_codon:yes stop_codon:yes gene_type:complete
MVKEGYNAQACCFAEISQRLKLNGLTYLHLGLEKEGSEAKISELVNRLQEMLAKRGIIGKLRSGNLKAASLQFKQELDIIINGALSLASIPEHARPAARHVLKVALNTMLDTEPEPGRRRAGGGGGGLKRRIFKRRRKSRGKSKKKSKRKPKTKSKRKSKRKSRRRRRR